SIWLIRAGNLATALTFSSQGCASILGILFVSLTKRAACTISTGYADAGSRMAMSGSGCSAMGMASCSSLEALLWAGADGGGAGLTRVGSGTTDGVGGVVPLNTGGGGSCAAALILGRASPRLMLTARARSRADVGLMGVTTLRYCDE